MRFFPFLLKLNLAFLCGFSLWVHAAAPQAGKAVKQAQTVTKKTAAAQTFAPLSERAAQHFLEVLKKARVEAEKPQPPPPPKPKKNEATTPAETKPAEEEKSGTAKTDEGTPVPAEEPQGPSPEDLLRSALVILKDDNLSTCGFYTKLWNVPVILTTARNFVTLLNPQIRNARNEKFGIRAAVVSKHRDLAILELSKIPEGATPLELNMDLSQVQPKTSGAIYFLEHKNLLLEQVPGEVVTCNPGENIFITNAVTSENSGSPLLSGDNKVFGVISYRPVIRISEEEKKASKDGKGNYSAVRLDSLKWDEFEFFDLNKQTIDLKIFSKLEKVRNNCLMEITEPHYKWSIGPSPEPSPYMVIDAYWSDINNAMGYLLPNRNRSGGMNTLDISQFGNRIYCYEQFMGADFHLNHHCSLTALDNLLKEQQQSFCKLFVNLSLSPLRPTEKAKQRAEYYFNRLQKLRRPRYICGNCGGLGTKPVPFDRSMGTGSETSKGVEKTALRVCRNCCYLGNGSASTRGGGSYSAPFYLPFRTSPLILKASLIDIGGFRLGMNYDVAMNIIEQFKKMGAVEIWTARINGLIDCVAFSKNPVYPEKSTYSYLKFVAKKLSSIAIAFESDLHNFNHLENEYTKRFGNPVLSVGEESDWGYILYRTRDGMAVTVNLFEYNDMNYSYVRYGRGYYWTRITSYTPHKEIQLRAQHPLLEHVEYLVFRTLQQKLCVPPVFDQISPLPVPAEFQKED